MSNGNMLALAGSRKASLLRSPEHRTDATVAQVTERAPWHTDKPVAGCTESFTKDLSQADECSGPTRRGPKLRSLEFRLWRKTLKTDGCWPWQGSRSPKGYGQIRVHVPGGQAYLNSTHRVSWEIANGRPVPEGMYVCHRCDNPPCVRPDHLFVGTPTDNNRDTVAKGRWQPRLALPQPYPDGFATFARTAAHGFLVLDRQSMPLTWFDNAVDAQRYNRLNDDAWIVRRCIDGTLIGSKKAKRLRSWADAEHTGVAE